MNGSVDHVQRTNRYRNKHDQRDRQTDRQTDTIEGRKAAFQGVQSVTRGEIANGVMVAEEQVKIEESLGHVGFIARLDLNLPRFFTSLLL